MGTTQSTNQALLNSLAIMNRKFRQGFYSLDTGSKNLTELGAHELATEIETNYKNFIASLSHDHQDHSHHIDVVPRGDGGYDVSVVGGQVLYDEFGTGIKGFSSPHPKKGSYNLNGYNTGAHIKHFPDSSKDYWVYLSDGRFVSTHGVPAGQFMYDSVTNMASGIWINNYYKRAFSDFFNIMKGK